MGFAIELVFLGFVGSSCSAINMGLEFFTRFPVVVCSVGSRVTLLGSNHTTPKFTTRITFSTIKCKKSCVLQISTVSTVSTADSCGVISKTPTQFTEMVTT